MTNKKKGFNIEGDKNNSIVFLGSTKELKIKEYPDEIVQEALIISGKLSSHYSKKFPFVDFDEFFSISMVAISQALKTYKKEKGSFDNWCSHYIYSRFNNFLLKEKRKHILIRKLKDRIKTVNGISL